MVKLRSVSSFIAAVALVTFLLNSAPFAGIALAVSAQLHNDAGQVFVFKGQYKEAVKEFLDALDDNPNFFDAFYNLGRTYRKMGDLANSMKYLKKAVVAKPEHTGAKALLKKVQQELSKDSAPDGIDKFAKNSKIQMPAEISYPFPDFTEGFYAYYMGNTSDASDKFERDFKNPQKAVHAFIDQGIIYYHLKYYSEAISVFKKAVAKDPNNAHAIYNMGLAYEQSGKREEAIESFEKATLLDSSLAKATERLSLIKEDALTMYVAKANNFFENSEWKKAIEMYEKAKSVALPNSAELPLIESNLRVARTRIDSITEKKQEINQAFLTRNVDFFDANSNVGRYTGALINWKARIFAIEKKENGTDLIMVYLPSFRSNIDSTEYNKDLFFVVRSRKNLKNGEYIVLDSNVVVVGKIIGREVLENALKYNTHDYKVVVDPLKLTFTNPNSSGELVVEFTD